MKKVCKFGGSSLCDGNAFLRAREILLCDEAKEIVVVSGFGKRFSGDLKATDILIECSNKIGSERQSIFLLFYKRIEDISVKLCIFEKIKPKLQFYQKRLSILSCETIISLGELFSGLIMSELTGFKLIKSEKLIKIKNHKIELKETAKLIQKSRLKKVVVPGFYGSNSLGQIALLERGGSDTTGAVLAVCKNAQIYENWTDVDGVYENDPKLSCCKKFDALSYKQAINICKKSNHPVVSIEALELLKNSNITTIVKSARYPCENGTVIYK